MIYCFLVQVSTGEIDSIGGGAPCVRYGFAAPLVQLTSMARAAASRCNASSLTLTRVSAMSGVMGMFVYIVWPVRLSINCLFICHFSVVTGAGASVSTRRISHLRMNTSRRPKPFTAHNDTDLVDDIADECMDDEDTDRDKELPANYVKV